MSSLPDDLVVLEIFPRLKDAGALFRCAAVCKQWRDLLVGNPSFLRHCLSEEACRRSSPFAGFFTPQQQSKGHPVSCFVPGPRPVLGEPRLLSSLVPGMGDSAVPLTSRHGLLLVRAGRLLIVCDPLAGTSHPLPHLDHDWDSPDRLTGYAMLTAADCCSSPSHNHHAVPFFKVMIIVLAKYPMRYHLYTYSSSSSVGDLVGWNKCSSRTPGDNGKAIHVETMQHNAVVSNGFVHWHVRGTLGFYCIDVCAETDDVCTRKLVDTTLVHDLLNNPAYDEPYVSVDAQGRLVYLCLRIDGTQLDIRAAQNGGTDSSSLRDAGVGVLSASWNWLTNHVHTYSTIFNHLFNGFIRRAVCPVPPDRPSASLPSLYNLGAHKCLLGEKNGSLIIKDDHQQRIYVADLKTGVMQEITDCPPAGHSLSRTEIVPLDMDWPALFISRLGVVAST